MIFLKLGGSLITDKSQPDVARTEVLRRLASEIREAQGARPNLALLLGHGAGSFGHQAAARTGTHIGATGGEDWRGFAEVWYAANRLHRIVLDALRREGIPALSFPPSASALSRKGVIQAFAVEPIIQSLNRGLLPVVFGDVAFDEVQGSAILSTEEVFRFLAETLQPDRLLLAGIEPGVYRDFPERSHLMAEIGEADLPAIRLRGSAGTDVTGGMAGKVQHALAIAKALPGLEVRIFSGEYPGAVRDSLLGAALGTRIRP